MSGGPSADAARARRADAQRSGQGRDFNRASFRSKSGSVSSWVPPTSVSATTRALLELLQPYTAFPWAFVVTIARRVGVDPAKLEPHQLNDLIQPLSLQLASLSDVDRAFELKRELTILAGTHPRRGNAA